MLETFLIGKFVFALSESVSSFLFEKKSILVLSAILKELAAVKVLVLSFGRDEASRLAIDSDGDAVLVVFLLIATSSSLCFLLELLPSKYLFDFLFSSNEGIAELILA